MRYIAVLLLMVGIVLQVACNKETSELKASDLKVGIVEYGIYQYPGEKIIVDAPGTPAGYKSKTKNGEKIIFIKQTDAIPMKKDVVFGYKVKIGNLPRNSQHTFILRYEYPPMTGHDGKISTEHEQPQNAKTTSGTIEGGVYYVLSEDYEMVPGDWNLSVLYKGEEIASKSFTLVE